MSTAQLEVPALTPPAPARGVNATVAAAAAPRGRASWSGLLRFRLVAFPVKAYPVTGSAPESHFNQLHADCGQRIRYEKHCPVHGKVDAGALVSGYRYAPDQYLILDEAELDQLRPVKDKALCLEHFLNPEHMDPLLYAGRSLYLLPDGPAAHQPYRVLAQGMQQRHKWALGWIVLGGHRHLALTRPCGPLLTLHVLHYPAQLRGSNALEAELGTPDTVSTEEIELAGMLMDASSPAAIPWPDFRDDTAQKLAALVAAKLQGQPLPAPVQDDVPVLRLLDALKQSVAEAVKQKSVPVLAAPSAGRGKKKTPRRSA